MLKFAGYIYYTVCVAAVFAELLVSSSVVSSVVAVSTNKAADAPHNDPGWKEEAEDAVDEVKHRTNACIHANTQRGRILLQYIYISKECTEKEPGTSPLMRWSGIPALQIYIYTWLGNYSIKSGRFCKTVC